MYFPPKTVSTSSSRTIRCTRDTLPAAPVRLPRECPGRGIRSGALDDAVRLERLEVLPCPFLGAVELGRRLYHRDGRGPVQYGQQFPAVALPLHLVLRWHVRRERFVRGPAPSSMPNPSRIQSLTAAAV